MEKRSEVIQFLTIAWRNAGHGWLGLNNAMWHALRLAIKADFKFEREDFITISKEFRFGYWGGAGSGPNSFAESFYAAACSTARGEGNRTAAIAFELYKKRPAFTFNGKRLAEGSKLRWWDGVPPELTGVDLLEAMRLLPPAIEVEISSFAADGSYLNAVWHEKPYREREAGKGPDRRFRITRDDLKRVAKALNPDKPKPEPATSEVE